MPPPAMKPADLFELVAVLTVLSALFSYINARINKLPTTIGVMIIALMMSLGMLALDALGLPIRENAKGWIDQINFHDALMQWMLGFLLFAGALHVDLSDLASRKWAILSLATVGVLVSTAIVGGVTLLIVRALGLPVSPMGCLLFGALISPTDPIAVMGILKSAGVPKSISIKIAGESLFNDGVGVVLFLALLGIAGSGAAHAAGPESSTAVSVAKLFLVEVLGGLALGGAAGAIAFAMLRRIDQYQVEILITLALVFGAYALADRLHVSGPLAMVVAGLIIGNYGTRFALSPKTNEDLSSFWALVDEFLNAVLFLLIGLEVLVIGINGDYLPFALTAIAVALFARAVSAASTVTVVRQFSYLSPGVIPILTWGGLRGGISVALALSLPQSQERDIILTATYCVVLFSIIVQGLTIAPLARRVLARYGADELVPDEPSPAAHP